MLAISHVWLTIYTISPYQCLLDTPNISTVGNHRKAKSDPSCSCKLSRVDNPYPYTTSQANSESGRARDLQ